MDLERVVDFPNEWKKTKTKQRVEGFMQQDEYCV